jgi:Protein of unknown function (DUF2786)
MTPERKRIADKIIKLLALANSSTFAGEAETARRMAEELMQMHNVEPWIKTAQDGIEMRKYVPFAKGMRWEGTIAGAVAQLCSCAVFFRIETLDLYVLVGTAGDLDMLDYMLREVNRQRIAAWLKYKGENGSDKFNKFCYGFAEALKDKINTIAGDYKQRHETLVLWYEANVIHQKTSEHQLSMGAASSTAGIAAGDGTSLHRGALKTPQKLIGRTR